METKLKAVLPDHDLLKLYVQMLLSRESEESCAEQYTTGHVTGFLPLYSGQEAVAVGATAALHKDDYILSAYREHAQAVVCGAEPKQGMAELFGKATAKASAPRFTARRPCHNGTNGPAAMTFHPKKSMAWTSSPYTRRIPQW